MKNLRKIIQRLLLESSRYDNLADLLLSNDQKSIKQAIELGETLGLLKLENTFDRKAEQAIWGPRRTTSKERVFCLTVEPPLLAELKSRPTPSSRRMSTYAAGYEGGVWIFCELDWRDE